MRLDEFRQRIVDECPAFASVVDIFTSAAQLDLPAAMVGPVRYVATPLKFMGADIQTHHQIFGAAILLRRAQDGIAATDPRADFDTLRDELHAALVGWIPSGENAAPLSYVGGELERYSEGVTVWREDFSTTLPVRTP